MTADEIVSYRDGNLSGECIADYADLSLRDIPWDTIKPGAGTRYRLIKSSHTRRVVSFSFLNKKGAEETVFAKRCRVRSFRKRLAQLFIPSKARREWHIARAALARGVPTVVPLLYAEKRQGIWLTASYLVTRELARFLSVRSVLKQIPRDAQKCLLGRLAEFVRTQHDAGFYHDDCSTRHVFVKGAALKDNELQFSFIDLDNAKLLRYVSLYKRVKNVFQLLRSLPESDFRQQMKLTLFNGYFSRIKDRRRKRRLIAYLNLIAWMKREAPPFRLKRQ